MDEQMIEQMRDAILETMDVTDGLDVEAAETYARAAHSVMAGKVAELTATVAKLREALGNSDALPAQLLLDADEMEACGAGNEAANMRKLVDRLLAARAALAPQIKGTDQP